MSENYAPTGERYLDAVDCTIFFGMLAISVAIGLYFAFVNRRKPNTASEYLTGNKELPVFPIAMSLCSSYISAITFMAQPAEIYNYGSQMAMVAIVEIFAVFAMLYLLMPVFYNLDIISSYEYLTKRFNYKIGMLGSSLFVIKTLLYSSVVLYFPAIVVSQLFGWNLEIIIPVLSIACIFYTSLGGFRAVVWTDTLQTFYMTAGAFTITILGLYQVGGFTNVWERNEKTGRIEFFNFDPDPRTRTTFWTVAIGFFTFSLSEKSVNQMVMQRFSSLSNFKKVKTTSWIFAIFLFTIFAVTSFNGLIAFATFYDCDPVTTKAIAKFDQIMSYLWMYLTQGMPGLPGLFVSAIFTASLSTISTNLNSTAGVFVIDVVKPFFKKPITETKETFLIKLMVVVFGCLLIVFAFVIDQLTGLYQVALSVVGVMNGPIFGMFILGMFFPRVSAKAVFVATLASFGLVTWIYVGSQIAVSQKQIIYPSKPFSIEGCDNSTLERYYSSLQDGISNIESDLPEPFPLYALSYQYYALIGSLSTTLVGLILSYLPGFKDKRRLNINLFSPIIRKFIEEKCENAEPKFEKNGVIERGVWTVSG